MGKLSRQERIGAMVLAAIALLITGGAFLLRRCGTDTSGLAAPQVRAIYSPEDAYNYGLQDSKENGNDPETVHEEKQDSSGLSKAGQHLRSRKDSTKRNTRKKKASKKRKRRSNGSMAKPQTDSRNLYDPFVPVPLNTTHGQEKDSQKGQ